MQTVKVTVRTHDTPAYRWMEAIKLEVNDVELYTYGIDIVMKPNEPIKAIVTLDVTELLVFDESS